MATIIILNGPNLNLVGRRQPEIYGTVGFDEYIPRLQEMFEKHTLIYHQSNHEGALIDWLHRYGFTVDGILLNAGGLTHTSVALADAVAGITTPVVEVHISDIGSREGFRRHSYLTSVCAHTIMGEGLQGYEMGVKWLLAVS